MMPSYEKLAAYVLAHGLDQGQVSWEHYISDPGDTNPQDMVTHIYIMLEKPQSDLPGAVDQRLGFICTAYQRELQLNC